MADIYPEQTRAIDPYSSYNSNVVNKLTRIVTRGEDALHSSHALNILRLTNTTVNLLTGVAFVDDVYIQITATKVIDLTDADYYFSNPWNEAGNYIVALAYNYVKAKPAPEAAIKIYKPSEHAQFIASGNLFLKCLVVTFNGLTFQCDSVLNAVPTNPTVLKREYTQIWAGREVTTPTFTLTSDEGRIIYVENKDELLFGTSARWESVTAVRDNINTQACTVGQLAYVGADGQAHAAISTGIDTFADCVILQVGTLTSGVGFIGILQCRRSAAVLIGRGAAANFCFAKASGLLQRLQCICCSRTRSIGSGCGLVGPTGTKSGLKAG